MLELGLGAGNALSVYFFLFPLAVYTERGEYLSSLGKCSRRIAYEYSIGDVTTWSWVNLATPNGICHAGVLTAARLLRNFHVIPYFFGTLLFCYSLELQTVLKV